MKHKKIFYLPIVLILLFSLGLLSVFLYSKYKIDYTRDEMLFKESNHSSVISIYVDGSGNYADDITSYVPVLKEEICLADQQNQWASLDEVPQQLVDAFLCTEDRSFYRHNGVNLPRTFKALVNLVTKKEKRFGASTLTQQVIKNISGDNDVSIKRKFDEILRAYHLESQHTKEQILEMYLNIVPMGDNLVGVKIAARYYFDKELSELSLEECATLVAITNAPSRFHPIRHPDAALEKRNTVLHSMYECEKISEDEYQLAKDAPLITKTGEIQTKEVMSWFAETVISQVKDDLMAQKGMTEQMATMMLCRSGMKIYTTEDERATRALEEVFRQRSEGIEKSGLCFSMVIVNNQTGNLSAILGRQGQKEANRLLNLATDTPHTPGSSLKPIALYAPLLDRKEINMASVFDDIPLEYIKSGDSLRPYPQNYPRRYDGLTTVSDALRYSKNTVATHLYHKLGCEKIYSHLTGDFSFKYLLRQKYLTDGSKLTDLAPAPLALGQLTYGVTLKEITDAYTVFAREGIFSPSKAYLAVYDKEGNVLLENKNEQKRVYKTETARIMNQLLLGVVSSGTAKSIKLKKIVDTAGKTGTSGDDKDRLFIGYTPYFTAGIWCAREDGQRAIGSVSVSHLSLWDDVMIRLHEEALEGEDIRGFSTGGLVRCQYCMDSGECPGALCELDLRGSRIAQGYFTPDNMPKQSCEAHIAVLYDTLCNAVANDGCLQDSEVKIVALVRMPKREFQTETVISDAEYMMLETERGIRQPDSYDLPYYYYALPDGIFVGRGREKKQRNSACYYHKS